ncbi:MAG: hypothetical protein HYV13_01415 [Candidatus Doudnabacteria bacterium]|nr:hypothetical protein [Candidatus Doudnabacteria bacterium]
MRQSTITKIKNGKITLPKDLQKEWKEGEVLFMRSSGGFLIKSITPPSLSALRPKLKKLGKLVSSKDIDDAVSWARQKTYAGRT